MRPAARAASASAASLASPSKSAPPMTALRCPPVYALHGMGAPEVRMVSPVMSGTISRAGRTSTSTGSAAHIRSAARALAAARRSVISARGAEHAIEHPAVDLVHEHPVMREAAAL